MQALTANASEAREAAPRADMIKLNDTGSVHEVKGWLSYIGSRTISAARDAMMMVNAPISRPQ